MVIICSRVECLDTVLVRNTTSELRYNVMGASDILFVGQSDCDVLCHWRDEIVTRYTYTVFVLFAVHEEKVCLGPSPVSGWCEAPIASLSPDVPHP